MFKTLLLLIWFAGFLTLTTYEEKMNPLKFLGALFWPITMTILFIFGKVGCSYDKD